MQTAVHFKIMGVNLRAVFPDTVINETAKDKVLAEIAKSFEVVSVEAVKPAKKRKSLFETYKDGFVSKENKKTGQW
mgnify:CR=1 FL=1